MKSNVDDGVGATKSPVTPRKRAAKAMKDEPDSSDVSPSKRAKGLPIPTSLDEACEADKLLLHLRNEENTPWADIAPQWTRLTGIKCTPGNLTSRFYRIKASIVGIKPEHENDILSAKAQVEHKFESEKWALISDVVEKMTGIKYPPATLQKKIKQLSKTPAAAAEI